ncbi:Tigger transposable element-derived-like protein [Temnothorax longispinosus]|uniref:Tigger transposable element-derived-like protein n=1 Tax=Temnothorax longispinosus TaxID=300112 RepID=A0A4S2KGY9_9HYME|nr:Tigger transposable element-derived-like protein [Temnothorax longispinosus]
MAKTKKEKKRQKYTEETLKAAVAAAKAGRGLRAVSLQYNVPKTTIRDKMSQPEIVLKKGGPPTVLSDEEEQQIVQWMMHMSVCGFPVTKSVLISSVASLMKELNRENPFTNNCPGRSWYDGFLKRHPELAQRIAQNLSYSRSSVTEIALRKWFAEVKTHLEKENAADLDATRIFNCDESAFYLSPKSEKVLVKKGDKAVYNFINNDDKECLTVLFTASAAGAMAPPMILFTYERIPASISASIPESWGIGKTESGWMTGESFFEYVTNVFYPWLVANSISFPVVLYMDGHSSHLTMALSEFCRIHKIILVALYPNATHVIQPLDVAFFRPAKGAWRKATTEWRMNHNGIRMRKEHFAPLLQQALDTIRSSDILRRGFEACGLHPLNPDAVNYQKLISRLKSTVETNKQSAREIPEADPDNFLTFIEKYIPKTTLQNFKFSENLESWTGDLEDQSLFRVWSAIRQRNRTLFC